MIMSNQAFTTQAAVMGWVIVGFVGVLCLLILWMIFTRTINLSSILNEPGSTKASLSRLQFLIFTVVIALSLFLVIIGNGDNKPPTFPPEIPPGIFALLGISGGTYLVSKGVQANKEVEMAKTQNPTTPV